LFTTKINIHNPASKEDYEILIMNLTIKQHLPTQCSIIKRDKALIELAISKKMHKDKEKMNRRAMQADILR